MTELPTHIHNLSKDPARLAADLLHHYSFELAGYSIAQQVEIWQEYYPAEWLPLAIIEALYQGRYKAISAEQILNLWQRRNHPVHHFNHEFERLICGNLPQPANVVLANAAEFAVLPLPKPSLSYRKMLLELPSVQAASKLERLSEIPSIKVALTQSERSLTPSDATPPQEPSPSLLPTPDRDLKEFKEGVVFGLSSGLAVRALKPRLRLELSQHFTPDWMSFLDVNFPNGAESEVAEGDRNSFKP